jgi:hypothetical protein
MSFAPIPRSTFEGDTGWKVDIPRLAQFLLDNHAGQLNADQQSIMEQYNFPEPATKPEDHLACFDFPYYLVEQSHRFEMVLDEWGQGQGVWNRVGKHMRFEQGLVDLAQDLLRFTLRLKENEKIPPVSILDE